MPRHLLLALFLLIGPARADFAVEWREPGDVESVLFAQALRDSGMVKDWAALDRVPLRWPEGLTLVLGDGEGPRFDPPARVSLPYTYLAEAVRAQDNFEETRTASLRRGLDMVEYTLYHLLAFALIGEFDVDRDTDADAIATWLMLTQFRNGGEQWLADSEAFGRASQKLDGPLSDYWHEHALIKAGTTAINCWVFGSDPKRYVGLFPGIAQDPDKVTRCQDLWLELDTEIERVYGVPTAPADPD